MRNRFEVVSNAGRVMARYDSAREANEERDRINADLEGCGLSEEVFVWVQDRRESEPEEDFPDWDAPGGLMERWDCAWQDGL